MSEVLAAAKRHLEDLAADKVARMEKPSAFHRGLLVTLVAEIEARDRQLNDYATAMLNTGGLTGELVMEYREQARLLREQLVLPLRCEAFMEARGWYWRKDPDVEHGLQLYDNGTGEWLAWISPRPGYCDRWHWQVGIECVPMLDEADAFPRYFMRLETAKHELIEFLAWRLFKVRI